MNVKPLLAGLIVMLLIPLVAQEAEACSASCFPGAFLPSNSDVPASIPGIYWVASRGFLTPVSPFDVGLTQITATGEMPVDVTAQTISDGLVYVLVPVAPLVPNADYVIRDSKVCEDGGLMAETTFHTTDAAPLPTKLGTIKVGSTTEGPIEVATRDGSCSTYVNGVSSSLELELDPEAAPYANAFDYETLVDSPIVAGPLAVR
ncbi:MAG TPA: hypothetical protein PK156_38215, partial [Polyangium sp.]|nr:hypothetical protein [Polyangium sp.]